MGPLKFALRVSFRLIVKLRRVYIEKRYGLWTFCKKFADKLLRPSDGFLVDFRLFSNSDLYEISTIKIKIIDVDE